jgi:hypothetical protein
MIAIRTSQEALLKFKIDRLTIQLEELEKSKRIMARMMADLNQKRMCYEH